jgi:TRAP-type C4-dicarboxylate transport system permease small subunit
LQGRHEIDQTFSAAPPEASKSGQNEEGLRVPLGSEISCIPKGRCCSGPEWAAPSAEDDWKGEKETLDRTKRLLNAVERIFTFLAMMSAFIMVLLTAADAMGRYFLNKPISGVYEITENYLMIFAVYFALAFAYREGANIRITFFVSRLSSQAKLAINYFVQIFSILFILFLLVSATRMNLGRLGDIVELSRKLRIPVWPAYLVISIGLLFMSLLIFLDLRHIKEGKSGLFKEESSEESVNM